MVKDDLFIECANNSTETSLPNVQRTISPPLTQVQKLVRTKQGAAKRFEAVVRDAETGKGTYDLYRLGLSYFVKGHNANFKIGYEHLDADADIGATTENSIDSFVAGCYVTY